MTRFLLDAMCGGLRAYLRVCGHDVAYALDRGVEADDAVAALAREEDRVVVTRDRDLAAATDGVLLVNHDPIEQLRELAVAGVDLTPSESPERCGRCNGPLEPVPETASLPEYAPDPAAVDVWRCWDCAQCFWLGSHWTRMRDTLAAVRDDAVNEES